MGGGHSIKMEVVFSCFYLAVMKNDSVPTVGHTEKFITCLISHPGRLSLSFFFLTLTKWQQRAVHQLWVARALFLIEKAFNKQYYKDGKRCALLLIYWLYQSPKHVKGHQKQKKHLLKVRSAPFSIVVNWLYPCPIRTCNLLLRQQNSFLRSGISMNSFLLPKVWHTICLSFERFIWNNVLPHPSGKSKGLMG